MSEPRMSVTEVAEIGEVLRSFAAATHRAQREIDLFSLAAAGLMIGDRADADGGGERHVDFDGERVSVFALGLTPSFLQIAEATLELKLSVEFQRESGESGRRQGFSARGESKGGAEFCVRAVDGRHAGVYQYSAEGASWARTRLAPSPAPATLLRLIQRLADGEEASP